jgi:hypothetical protein
MMAGVDEREPLVTSVSVSERALKLLELAVEGDCIAVCCTKGSASNVCFGTKDVRPPLPDCFGGTGPAGSGAGAAAFSASSASLRAANLRAIVAFLAPAEAFAACTRTAFRVSLLMPASNALKTRH